MKQKFKSCNLEPPVFWTQCIMALLGLLQSNKGTTKTPTTRFRVMGELRPFRREA